MTTTFVTRETARDALTSLFTTSAKWQKVFGYIPTENDIGGQSPFLVVVSNGTRQEMAGQNANKSTYYFSCSTWVRMSDEDLGGSFGFDDAEDLLDALDKEFRQVIRNTVMLDSGKAIINFADGQSSTGTNDLYKVLYRVETYMVSVVYPSGS